MQTRTRKGTREAKCLECGRWSPLTEDYFAKSHGRLIAVHRKDCYRVRYRPAKEAGARRR